MEEYSLKINTHYKLGGRAIKTALSVSLCIFISFVFGREDAFFASIAAMICMQQTYDKTFKVGLNRFIGTLLGGIIGYAVLEIICLFPYYSNLLDMFIAPLCILVMIYICNTTNRKESIIIGCIVLVSIVASPEKKPNDSLLYVVNRVIDTTIGIIVAMAINFFGLPNKNKS